jgi:uncharacterized protein (DUF2141 family)
MQAMLRRRCAYSGASRRDGGGLRRRRCGCDRNLAKGLVVARKIMIESTDPKALASVADNIPMNRTPKTARYATWFAVLLCSAYPYPAFSQSVHIQILGIRSSTGMVACTLFESPVGFPADYLHSARNIMSVRVKNNQAQCNFEGIPPGTYAIAVAHDENMNGKLDTNGLGIPAEGYGFSNNAVGWLGAPSFSDASFSYDGGNLNLTIRLHY